MIRKLVENYPDCLKGCPISDTWSIQKFLSYNLGNRQVFCLLTEGEETRSEWINENKIIGYLNNNLGFYKGQRFWSGAVDLQSGLVTEVHTYEKAQAADFHACFYFNREPTEESAYLFFSINNGKIVLFPFTENDYTRKMEKMICKHLSNQIRIEKPIKVNG